jgi:N-acyl-D-amino-acid deacylase
MSLIAKLLALALFAADPVEADYILRNGEIYDGSDAPAFVGDVAIKGDRIVAVHKGKLMGATGTKEIDVTGLIVAPGFIDLHSHSDSTILAAKTRINANYLTQGCTSVVTGNCGSGPVGVADYYRKIDEQGAGTNILHLIPHGRLRTEVMGRTNRAPSPAELEKMKKLVERGMLDGAWGMSTGLIYVPGTYSKTDELVVLAKVVAERNGIYASHVRNEGSRLLESLDEILRIGREAQLPVHVSHIKVSGKTNWGLAPDAIQKLRDARAAGQQVTADQYPYPASSTSLAATLIPDELRDWKDLKTALDDPERGDRVRKQIAGRIADREGGRRIVIANFRAERSWQGKSLATIAADTNQTPLEVVIDIMGRGGAQVINFAMNEDEVRLFMREPFVATASDGSASSLDSEAQPHPRSFGTFSRKIGHYAIEGKFLPLGQAIRSASGLPADILGLPERGYLKPGYFADVLVFDPATFRDQATFAKPLAWSTGVKLLFVNGEIAVEDAKPTGKLAGRALRHRSPE